MKLLLTLVILCFCIPLSASAHEPGEATVSLWDRAWHQVEDTLPFLRQFWPTKAATIPRDSEALFHDEAVLREYVAAYGLRTTVDRLAELSSAPNNCHQFAHKAGRFAYEIYGNDIFRIHTAACLSGGMHGAAEEFFRTHGTKDLDYLLNTICFQYGATQVISECLHGVGHGLMAWSDYELPQALVYCDQIKDKGWAPACYSGVFMENVLGALATEAGHISHYISPTDLHYPCTVVDEPHKKMCYYHQPSRMMFMIGHEWPVIAHACENAPAATRSTCYQGIGKELPWKFQNAPEPIFAVCSLASSLDFKTACLREALIVVFDNSVSREPAARQVCLVLPLEERGWCDQFVSEWQQWLITLTSEPAAPALPSPQVEKRAEISLDGSSLAPVTIDLYDDRFEPRDVTLKAGQTVNFVNRGTTAKWPASNIHPTHRIYPGSDIELCGTAQSSTLFDACEGIATGQTYSFQFIHGGMWRWHDHLNPPLAGVILVE